jgi:hypothetical protein
VKSANFFHIVTFMKMSIYCQYLTSWSIIISFCFFCISQNKPILMGFWKCLSVLLDVHLTINVHNYSTLSCLKNWKHGKPEKRKRYYEFLSLAPHSCREMFGKFIFSRFVINHSITEWVRLHLLTAFSWAYSLSLSPKWST